MHHAYYNYNLRNITINTHKLKWVLFLILDYESCFQCLIATLLIITFPIFSAFFA